MKTAIPTAFPTADEPGFEPTDRPFLGADGTTFAGSDFDNSFNNDFGGIAAGPGISCAYPLDATAGEITGLGEAAFPTRVGDYDGEFSVLADGSGTSYLAGPTGIPTTNAKLDMSGGKKLVELKIDSCPQSPATGGTAVHDYYIGVLFYDFANAVVAAVHAGSGNASPTNSIRALKASTVSYTSTGGASTGNTCAIGYEDATGELVWFYNGAEIERTAKDAGMNMADISAFLVAGETVACPAANAGLAVGGTFVSDAANMQSTYPAGWTDPCGNAAD